MFITGDFDFIVFVRLMGMILFMFNLTKLYLVSSSSASSIAFPYGRDKYVHSLTAGSWYNLFSEGTIEKLGALIVTLYRRMKF